MWKFGLVNDRAWMTELRKLSGGRQPTVRALSFRELISTHLLSDEGAL